MILRIRRREWYEMKEIPKWFYRLTTGNIGSIYGDQQWRSCSQEVPPRVGGDPQGPNAVDQLHQSSNASGDQFFKCLSIMLYLVVNVNTFNTNEQYEL
ncbi:hypothetical protein Trydic_g22867 [Trypoxylus dichotomus]